MIVLEIPKLFIEKVLLEGGYSVHPRGYKHGYVRDLSHKKRWHAYPKGDTVEIHLDRTSKKNRHFVESRWQGMEGAERSRLKKIWRGIDPVIVERRTFNLERRRLNKEKKISRNVYASNLPELQRNIVPKVLKRPLRRRLKIFVTSILSR